MNSLDTIQYEYIAKNIIVNVKEAIWIPIRLYL